MIEPPVWSNQHLDVNREASIRAFRRDRLEEPIDAYAEAFDDYQGIIEELLELTVDLYGELDDEMMIEILTNDEYLDAFRYCAGPPISRDDLQTLADAASLAPTRIKQDRDAAERIVRLILDSLDRRRFPWVAERREPTEAEKNAATLASAALMAYMKHQTMRRSQGKLGQEARVSEALEAAGLVKITTPQSIQTIARAPKEGTFCSETTFGGRKADFVVGLWDGRRAAIECKVSNSELNSVKRLNNDAAVKARVWVDRFGKANVVPIAVLSGAYKLTSLVDAQRRGLTLFWDHDLDQLLEWIESLRDT